ncbi:MAG: hypothetical protein WAM14_19380 [Candidatus Nitrosopolaris sp.]
MGGLIEEQNKITQQNCLLNAFMANKQQSIMALFRLQSMGINEDQILNIERFLQRYNGQQHAQQLSSTKYIF